MKAMCWAALVMMVSLSLVSQAAQPGVKMAIEAAHWAAGLKMHGKAPASPSELERRLLPCLTTEVILFVYRWINPFQVLLIQSQLTFWRLDQE